MNGRGRSVASSYFILSHADDLDVAAFDDDLPSKRIGMSPELARELLVKDGHPRSAHCVAVEDLAPLMMVISSASKCPGPATLREARASVSGFFAETIVLIIVPLSGGTFAMPTAVTPRGCEHVIRNTVDPECRRAVPPYASRLRSKLASRAEDRGRAH
jgi:hypothetical protein